MEKRKRSSINVKPKSKHFSPGSGSYQTSQLDRDLDLEIEEVIRTSQRSTTKNILTPHHHCHSLSHRLSPQVVPSGLTSREKRDFNEQLHASFSSDLNGSIEELLCDEIDDILPKTDYTYVRTATYSPKYLSKTKYISPNMSRRKIRAMNTSFLSEDDDSDSSSQFFVSESSKTHTEVFLEQPVQQNVQQNRRSKNKHLIFTSTPMTPHAGHQISTNDHYYDGMLLRSGSHIKGVKRLEGRLASETPSTSGGASNMLRSTHQMKRSEGRLESEVASTSKADRNFIRSAHQRKGRSSLIELEDFENQNTNKTVTTVTTTTTTTYEEILNEEAAKKGEHDTNRRSEVMHDWDKISSLDAPSASKRTSRVDKTYESKLREDELQTYLSTQVQHNV